MRINSVCLVLLLAACTAHQQDEHETDHATEGAVQQQGTSYQASPPASKPAKPSASSAQSGQPAKPSKPGEGASSTPPQAEAPHEHDEPGDTNSASTDEVPTAGTDDEEVMEGCGPMGECTEFSDCVPEDPMPWVSYTCSPEGQCVAAPVDVVFNPAKGFSQENTAQQYPGAKLYLEMWRLSETGVWERTLNELPYTEPLQSLCEPLRKDAYIAPGINTYTPRVYFAYTEGNPGYVVPISWINLFLHEVQFLYQPYVFIENIVPIPLAMPGGMKGTHGFLMNLGQECNKFSGEPGTYVEF